MVSIDENTQVAMEIVSQGTKLTGELILKILRELNNAFENDKTKINKQFINTNEKSGKLKMKNLVDKHKEGIDTLEDNLTKEQLKEYSKEFKKLGVDFSTVKVGKDSYSLFFSAKDSIVVEKALKNIIEKKDLEISKEKTKDNNLDVDKNNGKEELENSTILNDKDKIINDLPLENDKQKITDKIFSQLTPIGEELFEKFNDSKLEEKENEHRDKDVNVSKDSLDKFIKDNNITDKDLDIIKKIHLENVYQNVGYVGENLDNQDKFIPMQEVSERLSEYKEIRSTYLENNSKEEQELNSNLFNTPSKEIESLTFEDKDLNITHKLVSQLTPEGKELFLKINEADRESLDNYFADSSKHIKSKQLDEYVKDNNISEKDLSDINKLKHEFVHVGTGDYPEGKLGLDGVDRLFDNHEKAQKELLDKKIKSKINNKEKSNEKTVFYSMDNIKKMDRQFKEENKDKEKTKKQELGR